MSIVSIALPVGPAVSEIRSIAGVERAAPKVDLAGSFRKARKGTLTGVALRAGRARPIRPARPPADLEGAVAALARRAPAARYRGGSAGPAMIGAPSTNAGAPSVTAAAPQATSALELDSPVSALLAAAVARAVGSFASAAGAISRPAASPSAPSVIAAGSPVTTGTPPTRRSPAATGLTPLEQAVHDLADQISRQVADRDPGAGTPGR